MNGLWGRFDQTLANVNTLYQSLLWKEYQPLNVYLMSEESILFCLQPVSKYDCNNYCVHYCLEQSLGVSHD